MNLCLHGLSNKSKCKQCRKLYLQIWREKTQRGKNKINKQPICIHKSYGRCKKCNSNYLKEWRQKNIDLIRIRIKKFNWITRKKVIKMLGGKCILCKTEDLRILQINHINGGGAKELKKISSSTFYNRIAKGIRDTKDLEVRCANCNILAEYERGKRKDWSNEVV